MDIDLSARFLIAQGVNYTFQFSFISKLAEDVLPSCIHTKSLIKMLKVWALKLNPVTSLLVSIQQTDAALLTNE